MNKIVFWGAIGLIVVSIGLSMVLILAPTILPFYSIKPEKYGALLLGSIFGHISTLIVISTVQHLMKKHNVKPPS